MPEEHLLEIIHLQQGNAESIYSTLVESLKERIFASAELWEWDFME